MKTVVASNRHSHTYKVSIPTLIKRLSRRYPSIHPYYQATKLIVWTDFTDLSTEEFYAKYRTFIELSC